MQPWSRAGPLRREPTWCAYLAHNVHTAHVHRRTHQRVHGVQVVGAVLAVDVHDVHAAALLVRQADIVVACTTTMGVAGISGYLALLMRFRRRKREDTFCNDDACFMITMIMCGTARHVPVLAFSAPPRS